MYDKIIIKTLFSPFYLFIFLLISNEQIRELRFLWVDAGNLFIKIANIYEIQTMRAAVPGKFYDDGTRIFDTKIIGDTTFMLYFYEKELLLKFKEIDVFS